MDHVDHVSYICTVAGMMMEDICECALTITAVEGPKRLERLQRLCKVGANISALLSAAAIIEVYDHEERV